jgi:hypothetical protein
LDLENEALMKKIENVQATSEDAEEKGELDVAGSSGSSCAECLRLAHADAIAEIERDRASPGQLTTGINGQVGNTSVGLPKPKISTASFGLSGEADTVSFIFNDVEFGSI